MPKYRRGGRVRFTARPRRPQPQPPPNPTEVSEESENDIDDMDENVDHITTHRKQCCIVCYEEFFPYSIKWDELESSQVKVFYGVLDIPLGSSDDDLDLDFILSLPFCPQCHSKIAVMFTLHTQMARIEEQFANIRNDIAFQVVETIGKNCGKGPIDVIRQQIYQKWLDHYNTIKERQARRLPTAEIKRKSLVSFRLSNKVAPGLVEMKITENGPLIPNGDDDENEDDGVELDEKPNSSSKLVHRDRTRGRPFTRPPHRFMHSPSPSGSPVPSMPKLVPMGRPRSPQNKYVRNLNMGSHNNAFGRQHPAGENFSSTRGKFGMQRNSRFMRMRSGSRRGISSGRGRFGTVTAMQMKKQQFEEDDEIYKGKSPAKSSLVLKEGRESEQILKCRVCPRFYSTQGRLLRHEQQCHPKIQPYFCKQCNREFSCTLTLRRHMGKIHGVALEGYMKCDYCHRSFVKLASYDLHLKAFHPRLAKQALEAAKKRLSEEGTLEEEGFEEHEEETPKPAKNLVPNKIDSAHNSAQATKIKSPAKPSVDIPSKDEEVVKAKPTLKRRFLKRDSDIAPTKLVPSPKRTKRTSESSATSTPTAAASDMDTSHDNPVDNNSSPKIRRSARCPVVPVSRTPLLSTTRRFARHAAQNKVENESESNAEVLDAEASIKIESETKNDIDTSDLKTVIVDDVPVLDSEETNSINCSDSAERSSEKHSVEELKVENEVSHDEDEINVESDQNKPDLDVKNDGDDSSVSMQTD